MWSLHTETWHSDTITDSQVKTMIAKSKDREPGKFWNLHSMAETSSLQSTHGKFLWYAALLGLYAGHRVS